MISSKNSNLICYNYMAFKRVKDVWITYIRTKTNDFHIVSKKAKSWKKTANRNGPTK